MKKIVMTGGGTGGHIIPNLALTPTLKKDFKIYYLGEANGMEENLVKKERDITFVPISAVKFVRKVTTKNLLIPIKLFKCVRDTKKILKEINPNIIFAKGGYVSLPVVLAGYKLKIPILAHESDFSVGLANKITYKFSKLFFTSFRETCIGNKCIYSGNPIRNEVFSGNKDKIKNICNFDSKKIVIMFFGGSLGSKSINNFVFDNIDKLSNYNIIHIVGRKNLKSLKRNNYCQIEYADNIYDFYDLADIVICRSGANSIFELLALKKLMILIPLSKKQSRGDQIENAQSFKKQGFAEIIAEDDLNFERMNSTIQSVLKHKSFFINNMQKARPNLSNDLICDYLLKYASSKPK